MTSTDLLDLFRSEMSDAEEDFLWSDDEVLSYINDAQTMFCRLTDGIADATTRAVTLLEYDVGDQWLRLHPSIKKIRSAYLVSNGDPVKIINQEEMSDFNIRFDGSTGPLRCVVLGLEENKARAWPVISVADSIQMTVFRLPLVTIDAQDDYDFEIAPQHHLHLLKWAKNLAYQKQDMDTLDKTKAAEFERMFRDYCAAATLEQQARRHKVRTVHYGGI